MRLRIFLAALAVVASPAVSHAAILVQIDKSTQSMVVSRDGETLHRWPVSTGRRGFDTPNGTFRAFRMEKDHFSKEWDDAPMPNSIFFTKKGHALHGYLDTKNIGRPASHGCVRLRPENASALYALVEKEGVLNTTVSITGDTPSGRAPVAQRAPRAVAPDGGYAPTDPNYQPHYGDQRYGQQPDPRDDQRYAPRYSYGDRPAVQPYDPRFDPRYRRRMDPVYGDEDDEDGRLYAPRRGPPPFFPFGSN